MPSIQPTMLHAPDEFGDGPLSGTVMSRVWLRQHQPAQIIILFPFAALILLGMAAMVIDGGRLFLGRQELQKAAEAAALDGALGAALNDPFDADPALNIV